MAVSAVMRKALHRLQAPPVQVGEPLLQVEPKPKPKPKPVAKPVADPQ